MDQVQFEARFSVPDTGLGRRLATWFCRSLTGQLLGHPLELFQPAIDAPSHLLFPLWQNLHTRGPAAANSEREVLHIDISRKIIKERNLNGTADLKEPDKQWFSS